MSQIVAGYVKPALKAAFEIGFIVLPSLSAATRVAEMGRKVLNTIGGKICPDVTVNDSLAKTVYEAYAGYKAMLPVIFSTHVEPQGETNDKLRPATITELARDAALYTAVAIVSTFVAHKFFGGASGICNQFFKYTGNGLRLATDYNVIQMGLNYVTGTGAVKGKK